MKKSQRVAGVAVAGLITGALFYWGLRPAPIGVDLSAASRNSIEVTVDDEARTRVRQVYTVSAPLSGRVLRIPYREGDPVIANETIVAVMQPSVPAFHDARSHQELASALEAANASVKLAEAEVRRIEAALTLARSDLNRARPLAEKGTISQASLDRAVMAVGTNEAALASAAAQLLVRRNERASVAARAGNSSGGTSPGPGADCCIQVPAPVTGRILKLLQESESVVQAGARLVDIGDPQDLEIFAELLSSQAVQVQPGAQVHIDGWGGPPLEGRVRRVEPAGFLKVSALGIEEQRVRTIIDFVDPPEKWRALGHDYRVIVHVVVAKAEGVLSVPVGALFRSGNEWAVFRDEAGRSRLTIVEVGLRNSRVAEIKAGLSQGDRVVLHPSDRVTNGTRITQRVAN